MVRRVVVVVVVGVDVVLIDDVVRDDVNRRSVGGTGEYVQHDNDESKIRAPRAKPDSVCEFVMLELTLKRCEV